MTAIVKYNAGNVQSVQFALDRLGEPYIWTDDPELLRKADRVIFPGVGEASSAMRHLRERGLDQVLPELQQPVLGICLGLQLFCQFSAENDTKCLGVFDTEVLVFPKTDPALKVPHIGWNRLHNLKGPLFEGISEGSWAYFVHSYYALPALEHSTALCYYGRDFAAAISRDNFFAVQFHPEKSGQTGQLILKNFIEKT
jgi:imidazole glycerol-phosphate synthase subunit HisH